MSTTQGLSGSGHSASGSSTSTAPIYTTTTATVPHGDGYFIEEVSVTLGPDLPSIPVRPSPSSDDVIVVDVDLGSSTLPAVIHSSESCLPSLVLTTTAASTLPPHPPAAVVVTAEDAAGKHHQSRDYDSVAPFLAGSTIPVLHLDTADLHLLPGSPLDAVTEGSQRPADESGSDMVRADPPPLPSPPRPPPPYSPHRLTGVARRLVAAVRAHRCQLCSFVALSSREVVDHLLVCHRLQLERLSPVPTSSQPAASARGTTAAVVGGGESTSSGGSTSSASSMLASRTVSVSGLARFVENKHGRMRLVATTSPPPPPTPASQPQQPLVSPTTVIVPSLVTVPADTDQVDDPPPQPIEATNPEVNQQHHPAFPTGIVLTALKRRGRPRNSRSLGLTSSILPRAPTVVEQKQMGVIPCTRVGCGVRLRQADLMELHERCHAPEEAPSAADVVCPSPTTTEGFVCFVCQYRSSQWTPMSLHLWRQHQIDLDLYRCNLCDFRTARYSQLVKQHLPTHGERRDHVCKLCHRRFKTTKQLYNHRLRVHRLTAAAAAAGDADVVEDKTLATRRCDDCQLLLSDRRALLTHRRSVHQAPSQRDRLQCAHCGRTFTCRSSLLLHGRQHSGRRLSCEHCDFTSTDHNTLRRHRMRHTGDRPYSCPHCPYSCIQSAQFKRHLRYKHPAAEQSLVLSCSLCPFRTIQLNAYRRHLVSHQHDQPSADVGNSATTMMLQDSSSSLELSDLQHRDSSTCSGGSAVKATSSDLQHRPLAPVSSLQDVSQDDNRVSSSRQTFSVLVSSGGGSPRQDGVEPSIVTFSFLTPSSHSAELEHPSDEGQGSAVTLCEDAAPTL